MFFFFFYRCHPVGPPAKSCIIPFYYALLLCYHISPLSSILLLAQQRQVANFLPFNLQQFPCGRRTHTQEEEPMLPWVNWGRGLAKRQWREVKVFWKTHFSSAKAAGLKDGTSFASAFTSSHEQQGIKTVFSPCWKESASWAVTHFLPEQL